MFNILTLKSPAFEHTKGFEWFYDKFTVQSILVNKNIFCGYEGQNDLKLVSFMTIEIQNVTTLFSLEKFTLFLLCKA